MDAAPIGSSHFSNYVPGKVAGIPFLFLVFPTTDSGWKIPKVCLSKRGTSHRRSENRGRGRDESPFGYKKKRHGCRALELILVACCVAFRGTSLPLCDADAIEVRHAAMDPFGAFRIEGKRHTGVSLSRRLPRRRQQTEDSSQADGQAVHQCDASAPGVPKSTQLMHWPVCFSILLS